MERVITIISTKTSGKKVFNSNAETLGDLKREMDAQNIDYEGMDFLEGLTRTSMIDDDAVLPSNVRRNGVETNNLVFMLTNSNKKIESGMDRKDAYTYIKSHGLENDIKNAFGRNFTQVPTCELEKYIYNMGVEGETWTTVKFTDAEGLYQAMNNMNLLDMLEEAYMFIDKNKIKSPYSDEEIDDMLYGLNK